MRTLLPLAIAFTCTAASVGDFEARFAAGNLKSASAELKAYVESQVGRIQRVGKQCMVSTGLTGTQRFRFVGDVLLDGTVVNGEVDQQTPLTACFVEQMSKLNLGQPPQSPMVLAVALGFRP